MANKLFQGAVLKMRDAANRKIGIIDDAGAVIACSDIKEIGKEIPDVLRELTYPPEPVIHDGCTFLTVGTDIAFEHAVFVRGEDEGARLTAQLAAAAIDEIKRVSGEKFNKSAFIRSVVLGNTVSQTDIYAKCDELSIDRNARRAVCIIRLDEHSEIEPAQMLREVYPDRERDIIFRADANDFVLLRELAEDTSLADMQSSAESVADTFCTEFYTKATVGIGSIAESIRDTAVSYRQARLALEIGEMFNINRPVLCYDDLGICRLIYQLPPALAAEYMREIFKGGSLDILDKETIETASEFFAAGLNISEASRKLFIHRNTLIYRLDRILRITGLDLRKFDDAVTFKVALMIKQYNDKKSN